MIDLKILQHENPKIPVEYIEVSSLSVRFVQCGVNRFIIHPCRNTMSPFAMFIAGRQSTFLVVPHAPTDAQRDLLPSSQALALLFIMENVACAMQSATV